MRTPLIRPSAAGTALCGHPAKSTSHGDIESMDLLAGQSMGLVADLTRALELALYRTYCVPSISALLDRTGEFYMRTQKRYDDTALIVAEMAKWGYDSERGREALRRMNHAHHRFNISNDDYLYVLSTFIYEPVRWMDRFGWRKMTENEKLASYHFWYEIGRRMGIREIPDSYEKFQQFACDYERDNFRFAETNRRIGTATRDLFASWVPRIFTPLVRWGIYALLDDAMLASFGFPRPFAFMRKLVNGALKMRRLALHAAAVVS